MTISECKKERKRGEERGRGGGDKEQEGLRYFMILDGDAVWCYMVLHGGVYGINGMECTAYM